MEKGAEQRNSQVLEADEHKNINYSDSMEVSTEEVSDENSESNSFDIDEDSLKDVPPDDFPDMFFRMRNNFPQAVHAHEHVTTLLRWKKKNPDLDMAILAPEGDYKNGIIFFTIFDGCFSGSVYCHDELEKQSLQNALATTTKVKFMDQNICRFTCMTERSYESIQPFISIGQWCTSIDLVLWLPWYCAREIKINLPVGVEIRDLRSDHSSLINEMWPHKYPGSNELFAEMIEVNHGVGVFRNDDLLSWALPWYHGGIAIIQTVESEKLKGYSQAAVEALTKKMGDHLLDVHLNVSHPRKRDQIFFQLREILLLN